MKHFPYVLLLLGWSSLAWADLPWIQISPDSRGFVEEGTGRGFHPWGFNYDHDTQGRLLEDYWEREWPLVEMAFRDMRQMGANVVRIHLQFGKFMDSPTAANPQALEKLQQLVQLAESTGIYLDVTGLGCYHKQDVPAWYEALAETERWEAQAVFWEAVASICAASPAVFCYDLMNEPVVAGGNQPAAEWLGPGFGGKHFVQYITRDRAGRERPEIAKAWIQRQVRAIRQHDQRHLITVGLVDWSLDRPGLTSGFVPDRIAQELDFLAVHIYPEHGKVEAALETLAGFAAVGKPVIIEETYPLKCSSEELRRFITESRPHATGWIGFFWGDSSEKLKTENTIPAAIKLSWLDLFEEMTPDIVRTQP